MTRFTFLRAFLVGLAALGVLFIWQTQPLGAASDCGAPPLPPCSGQGAGEDPTGGSTPPGPAPTNTPGATCGYAPLPPCSGQGSSGGQTSTGGSTNQGSAPQPSSVTGGIVVSDVSVDGGSEELHIRFTSNRETTATVSLLDGLQTSVLPRTQRVSSASLSHQVTFIRLPETAFFQLKIEARDTTGNTLTKDDVAVRLTNSKPSLEEGKSQTSGGGQPGGTIRDRSGAADDDSKQKGLPEDSIFGPFVNNVLDEPLFVLGDRGYRRLDLLAWFYYVLVLAVTGLGAYFFLKRRRLWGIVYDARTKTAVEMAVIRLFDQEHHKLLETRVTPKSGRYSFLAEPGEFYLEVTKEGYHFPSRIVTQSIDNEYSNLYRGEVLKLGAGQSLIAPDVPIDTESGEVKQASFYRRVIFPLLDTVRLPILLLGLLLAPFMSYLTSYGYFEAPYLLLTSGFLLVIFLISEFLFVRRGRK